MSSNKKEESGTNSKRSRSSRRRRGANSQNRVARVAKGLINRKRREWYRNQKKKKPLHLKERVAAAAQEVAPAEEKRARVSK